MTRKTSYGVAVIVTDPDGRLVMQHRDNRPGIAYPDHWSVPTGGIRQVEDVTWETAAHNAIRELAEELGLTLTPSDMAPLICETLEKPTQDIVRYVFQVRRQVPFSELHPFDAQGRPKEGRSWGVLGEADIFDGRLIPPTILFLLERHFGRPMFEFMNRNETAAGTIAQELLQRFEGLGLRRVSSDPTTRKVASASGLTLDDAAFGPDVLRISYEDPDQDFDCSRFGALVSFLTETPGAPKLSMLHGHMRLITPRVSA